MRLLGVTSILQASFRHEAERLEERLWGEAVEKSGRKSPVREALSTTSEAGNRL